MRNKFILSTVVILSLVSACKSKSDDEVTVTEVDEKVLKKASQDLCPGGRFLTQKKIDSSEKLYHFSSNIVAFGFLKGNGRCALKKDIHQNGLFDEWYSVSLQNDCLENGSIWSIVQKSFPSHTTTLEIRQIPEFPDNRTKIQAGEMVTLRELYSSAGLISFSCE